MKKANKNAETKQYNKPIVIGIVMPKVEYQDLKTEFNAIQNHYIGLDMEITRVLLEEIDCRYKDLFIHFGLKDLQYRITKVEQSIMFTPIRLIDQYAIHGIMASPITCCI